MTYNPYAFVKTYNDRLVEFINILGNNSKPREIKEVWSTYVEYTVEPVGWQAIWKVSRDVCEDFKIKFPCTVIVIVEQVIFHELSCQVSITEVEDESIQFPERMGNVPLIELYPTVEQDNSCVLSLNVTANLIDSLRFFYNHLWMPWDLDSDEDIDWVNSHLEGRLKLYYSMAEYSVPGEIKHKVEQLVLKSHYVQQEIEEFNELLETDTELSPTDILRLTELHNQLSNLHDTYRIYENPVLLKALIERSAKEDKSHLDIKEFVYLVLSETSPEGLFNLANLTKQLLPESKPLRLMPSLEEVLTKAQPGAVAWLTAGKHTIRGLGALEGGGSLSGLEPGVVLTEETNTCSTIDLLRGNVALNSLTVSMTYSGNIIKVRPSVQCKLNKVELQGSSVVDGVDVFPGAQLTAVDCQFTSCSTAVVCYPDSTVHLTNCTFTDNNIAIELRGICNFSMENCSISGSRLCAVNLLIHNLKPTSNLTITFINSIPQMKESGTTLQNNVTDVRLITPICEDGHKNGHK